MIEYRRCTPAHTSASDSAMLHAALHAAREIYQQPLSTNRRDHYIASYQFFSALDSIAQIDTRIALNELNAFAHHVRNFRLWADPDDLLALQVNLDLDLAITAWRHEILHRYAACEVFYNSLADELFGDHHWADPGSPQAH